MSNYKYSINLDSYDGLPYVLYYSYIWCIGKLVVQGSGWCTGCLLNMSHRESQKRLIIKIKYIIYS